MTENPDNQLKRVPELWFSDCGLVIQAENSLFRVSGSMLAVRSSFFRDMLAFPQPANPDLVEGCPVVRLPDSAEDVTGFLTALFDSRCRCVLKYRPSSRTFAQPFISLVFFSLRLP